MVCVAEDSAAEEVSSLEEVSPLVVVDVSVVVADVSPVESVVEAVVVLAVVTEEVLVKVRPQEVSINVDNINNNDFIFFIFIVLLRSKKLRLFQSCSNTITPFLKIWLIFLI